MNRRKGLWDKLGGREGCEGHKGSEGCSVVWGGVAWYVRFTGVPGRGLVLLPPRRVTQGGGADLTHGWPVAVSVWGGGAATPVRPKTKWKLYAHTPEGRYPQRPKFGLTMSGNSALLIPY